MLHGAGIFTYIFPKNGQNVGNYSIHGAYGYSYLCQLNLGPAPSISIPKRCNPGWIGILRNELKTPNSMSQNLLNHHLSFVSSIFQLVGGLEHMDYFPYIGNFIIPTDFHIFQRGRYTTNQSTMFMG